MLIGSLQAGLRVYSEGLGLGRRASDRERA